MESADRSATRRAGRRLAVGILLGAIPAGGMAQEASPETLALDTIQVQAVGGDAGRTEGSGSFAAPATATATNFVLTPRETPQTVVIVTDQVIRDFNLTDLKSVLEATPGVYVENERNVDTYQFFSRGYPLQTQIDGLPSSNRIGGRSSIEIDSALLDRVEVVQGASGLLTGAGDPGGIVNLVRKMPTSGFQAAAETNLGPWGSARVMGDVSGPLTKSGSIRGRLIGVWDDSDSFVEEVWGEKKLGYGVIEVDLTETTVVSLGGSWEEFDGSNGAAYGNPTQLDGEFFDVSRFSNLGADWARDHRRSQTYFLKLDQQLPGDWSLRGQLGHYKTESDYLQSSTWYNTSAGLPIDVGIWGAREAFNVDGTSADLFATGPVTLFGRRHELMAGVSAARDKFWSGGYQETALPVQWIDDIYDHDPTEVPGPNSQPWVTYSGPSDEETTQYGGFAAGRFSLADPLHLIVGARVSWYEAEVSGETVRKEDAVFTPYAGVVYDFNDWGSVYASYAQIFQPQGLDVTDASGSVLPPEEGTNYEVGVKAEFFDGALNASAALFRLDQDNLATVDAGVPLGTCGINDCYTAEDGVVSQGVDLGLAGAIRPGWSVLAGYTWITRDYDDDIQDAQTETPEHLLKLSTAYEVPRTAWTVGGGVSYRSEIETSGEVGDFAIPYHIRQGGVFLVDLMARYDITENVYALLTLNNVFDETYYSGISVPNHGQVFGDPRNAMLTLRAEF